MSPSHSASFVRTLHHGMQVFAVENILCRAAGLDISRVTFGQIHRARHFIAVTGELRQKAEASIESAGEKAGGEFVRTGNGARESRFEPIAPPDQVRNLTAILRPVNKNLGCCVEAFGSGCGRVEGDVLEYRHIGGWIVRGTFGQMMDEMGRRAPECEPHCIKVGTTGLKPVMRNEGEQRLIETHRMKQAGQAGFFLAAQQGPLVQGNAQTSPTVAAKIFGQLTRIRYSIGLSRFPGELNTKSGRKRPLRNKRQTVRLDKRAPARFETLRMQRAAIEVGKIKIGTKHPGREARIQGWQSATRTARACRPVHPFDIDRP